MVLPGPQSAHAARMRPRSLRAQILALFLAAGLLPVVALSIASYHALHQAAFDDALGDAHGRALAGGMFVSDYQREIRSTTTQALAHPAFAAAVASGDRDETAAVANTLAAQSSTMVALTIVYPDGAQTTAGDLPSPLGERPVDGEILAHARGAAGAITDLPHAREGVVPVVAPLGGGMVVVAWFAKEPLTHALDGLAADGVVRLVGADGRPLLRPATGDVPPAVFAAAVGKPGSSGSATIRDADGASHIVGYVALPSGDGYVVYVQPAALVARSLLPLELVLGGLVLVVAAGMAMAVVVISRRLTMPIRNLAAASEAFASGNRGVRASVAGSAETVALASAFNRMADQIERQEAELRAHTATLEDEVAHRTRELRARNEELEGFNFAAAHDLREPLRSIETLTRYVIEDEGEKLSPDARHYLKMVLESSSSLQQLIFQLLHMDEVSRSDLTAERVDLGEVAREVQARLNPVAAERRGVIVVEGEFPAAVADRARVAEALQHLVDNGLRYNEHPTPRVVVRGRVEGGEAALTVEDNGIGIPADRYRDIFAPFKRLHRREAYPGLGAGLAIVKKVAERHDGRVEVESQPGTGSKFTLRIPLDGPKRTTVVKVAPVREV